MPSLDICLIIGARRWGRIVTKVACETFPESVCIILVSTADLEDLREWLKREGLDSRVTIQTEIPELEFGRVGIALVLNSAPLHYATTLEVLHAGYSALVEKPLSFSYSSSLLLQNFAIKRGLDLFSSNTVLFADYFATFRNEIQSNPSLCRIQIDWTDPIQEIRHGILKNYDSATPLIFDIVPHVATLLWAVLRPHFEIRDCNIQVERGGSEAQVHFHYGPYEIHARIARNSPRRQRSIQMMGVEDNLCLDFSSEPGLLYHNKKCVGTADPLWVYKRTPIAQMLRSLMEYYAKGRVEPRFVIDPALLANKILDDIVESYVDQQIQTLSKASDKCDPDGLGHKEYAMIEARSMSMRVKAAGGIAHPLIRLANMHITGEA
jgi:predicted dehydrogenase